MIRIIFAVIAAALFVVGPSGMPSVKASTGVGLVKADRVFFAQAVARIIDER